MPLLTTGAGTFTGGSGDPFFANTVLLMGFEGTNGSTGSPGMNDASFAAHGIASHSVGVTVSTAQFKFGASSLSTAASGGLTYADSADWLLSSANSDQFTIELFVRLVATGTNKIFVCQYTVDGTYSWTIQTASATEFEFGFSSAGTFASGTTITSSGAALTTGVWYHIAVDKDSGGKIRIYIDGTMVGSATPANSAFFNSSVSLGIGFTAAGGGSLNGFIDELRITKGAARYASDSGYTVPTAAFPRS